MRDTIDMAGWLVLAEHLKVFEALVRADEQKKWQEQTAVEIHEAVLDEREACAKVCEETEVVQTTYCMTLHDEGAKTLLHAAAAIRARGTNDQ